MTVAGSLLRTDSATPVCDVCGTVDALGLGTCAICASPRTESLIFVERSRRRADRRAIEAWLIDSLGGVIEADGARDAAEGVRPIVGLPSAIAGRVSSTLSVQGLTATPVPARRVWRKMPAGLVGLIGAILGAGLYAGLTATLWILGLSVAFAGLMTAAALRRLRQPVWSPEAPNVLGLPETAERRVRATLNGLSTGKARGYLAGLATLAAGLVNPGDGEPAPGTPEAVRELLELGCDAAVDLENLDSSLAVLERQAGDGPIDVGLAEAASQAAAARALLARKFDEALAALGRLQSASVDAPARLVELAEQLAEDASRRVEAWEAVQRLTA